MAGWKASLASVLKQHNGIKATDGTIASHETQHKRSTVLYQAFTDLRQMGYKLDCVSQFKGRHMAALAERWLSKELSASTLQNRLSTLRTFASWVGKDGMVERAERYFPNQEAARTSLNTQDKGWEANGVSVAQKLNDLRALDERVALQVELQLRFGLRVKESLMLRPHLADKGSYLAVSIGTKGGRDRTVPIDTPERRELIDRAKTYADRRTASTADPGKSLKQALGHYSRVVAKAGLTKAQLGVTSHGLRHAFANERYTHYSGSRSPVEGGDLRVQNRELDRFARLAVVEELGHSREDVSTHYLGR